MSGRYQSILRIQKEYIGLDCPVSLLAHAILLDTLENKKLVQLKLCNCSNKPIVSAKVSINAFDQSRSLIETIDSYEYASFNVKPGEVFGTQSPIYFSGTDLMSSLEIFVNEVHFADADSWKPTSKAPLKERSENEPIRSLLSSDLSEEYKETINNKADFVPVEFSGSLWSCSCGTLNAYTDFCRFCGAEKIKVFDSFDKKRLQDIFSEKTYKKACELSNQTGSDKKSISELTSALALFNKIPNYKDSSEKSAELNSLLTKLKREKISKRKERILWGICLGIVSLLLALFLVIYYIPRKTDERRGQIIDSMLSETFMDANALSDIPEDYYKQHPDKAYACGKRFIESQQWDAAEKYFNYCGSYDSSREYLKYIAAQKAIGDNDNSGAISNLEPILGFLDADELLGDEYLKHIRAEENMSLNDAIDSLSKLSSLSSEAESYLSLLQSLSRAEGSFKGSHRYQFDGTNFYEYSTPETAYNGDLSVFIYLNYGVAKANVYTELLPYAHDYKKNCNVVRGNDKFYQNDLLVEIPSGSSFDYIWLKNYSVIYVDHDNTLTHFNRLE